MSVKSLSEFVVYSKYAKFVPEKKRRETWKEQVDRVFDMHERKYLSVLKTDSDFKELFEKARESVYRKEVLGSQRALQFGGYSIEKCNEKMYNCATTYIDRVEAFSQIMYCLLAGNGVGFSVQKHHIAKLPTIQQPQGWSKTHDTTKVFIIPDSIEGWADAVKELVESYFYTGVTVAFDYSLIRPEGALITGGFKAPGPDGLKAALEKMRDVFNTILKENRNKLKPIEAYDIIMHASDAVLSGGVRRAATICLFSPDDNEMMTAKTGDWFYANPQRARSNNSALLVRKETSFKEFEKLMQSVKSFGEPGFVFAESNDHIFNPCFTGDTVVAVADGRNHETIKTLAEQDKPFPVYSASINGHGKWSSEIKTAIAFKTGIRKTVKITLSDGSSFKCTPEHKLAIPGGGYIQAKDALNVELEGFYTTQCKNYRRINTVSNAHNNQHRLIWSYNHGDIPEGYVIDHKTSGSADYIENLQILSKKEHDQKTGTEIMGKNNPVHRIEDTAAWKQNLSNMSFLENNPRFLGITNEELINNARFLKNHNRKITFDNLKILDDRTPLSFSKNRFGGSIRNLRDIVDNVQEYVEPTRTVRSIKVTDGIEIPTNPIVTNIEDAEVEDVYDLKVEDNSNFYILTSGDENYMTSKGLLVHNCVEIGMKPQTSSGKSGIQYCNLTEINGRKCDSREAFLHACEMSAIIGTLQAGYTDFAYLGKVSEEIVERESLIGCSVTGWMDQPDILFDADLQREGAELIKAVNRKIAKLIGINPAARCTCAKPAGTTSSVLGTASGIHPHHARRYIRNVQGNINEFAVQEFARQNPIAITDSVWDAQKKDKVISFMCEVPAGAIVKNSLSAIELLEKVKLTQQNWVESGTNQHLCADSSLRHNVSNTITVQDNEWDELTDYIYKNRKFFAGISLLPASGDLDYPQAPFTAVLTPTELVREYGDAQPLASGLVVDGLSAFDNNLWYACDVVCGIIQDSDVTSDIKLLDYPIDPTPRKLANFFNRKDEYETSFKKKDWVRRVIQFAERHFDYDQTTNDISKLRKCCACLKHVSIWKRWVDLKREYIEIDWSNVVEEQEERVSVDTLAAQACAGGACELK